MKKTIANPIFVLAVVLILLACASEVDLSNPQALMDEASDNGAFSHALEPLDINIAYSFFGLERDDYDMSLFYMSTASSEEFVFMQAVSASAYDAAVTAVERRLENQIRLYATYAPDEVTKLENARIHKNQSRRIIVYSVASDPDKLPF